jgi:GntR family transcriptional regulator
MEFMATRNAWRLADIDVGRKEKAPQIADRIREAVAAGVWRPAERLPSLGEIARRYGVSRTTVMVAMRALEDDGVVRLAEPVHAGYFVRGAA